MSKNKTYETPKVVYGFSVDRDKRDKLATKCQETYGVSSADFMRIVVDAVLEDRLAINRPEGIREVYIND